MTNNTIPNAPRELLERCAQYTPTLEKQEDRARALSELRALLSAQSPAGVDGLEVVAWLSSETVEAVIHGAGYELLLLEGRNLEPLCRLSSAQAIIDGLRGEVAELRKRAKTAEREAGSALRTYKGLEKVARVVSDNSDQVCGELNVLRQQFDQQAQRIGELEEERNYLKALQENAQLHIEGLIRDRDAVIKTSEPIYQYGIGRGNWTDITKDAYEEYASRGGEWSVRVVYSAALSTGKDSDQ